MLRSAIRAHEENCIKPLWARTVQTYRFPYRGSSAHPPAQKHKERVSSCRTYVQALVHELICHRTKPFGLAPYTEAQSPCGFGPYRSARAHWHWVQSFGGRVPADCITPLTRSTIEGGRGCNNFVPVVRGNGTKIAPTGDIFDPPPGGMS